MSRAQIEFVKWVRQVHPQVYQAAVSRVARKSALGGLGDDLTSDISFDPSSININPSVSASIDAATSGSGNNWSDIINSLAGAITQVAPQIVQTKAQLSAIQINAQRAANGLPINVTGASLLSGQGLGGNTGLMIGLVALIGGGLLLARGKKR